MWKMCIRDRSYPGAKEVGIEFYSLSKSYNMTGMRMSFAVGNRAIIQEFSKVRSQIDYGIFLPIQMAAVAALTGPQDAVNCLLYTSFRRITGVKKNE